MRRNTPWNQQGRGRGRGPPRASGGSRGLPNDRFGDNGAASGGPLMTDHIELHDLDLELALLKRKREIIETQQNILLKDPPYSGPSSQYRYDQPRDNYGQPFNQMRKYSNLYEDQAPPHYNRYDRQPSMKRSAPIEVWDSSPSSKRFGRPRPMTARLGPGEAPDNSQPPPLMSSSFSQSKYQPRHSTNFKPTKVSKSKTSTPNNLQSYPVASRKKLVENASNLTSAKNTPAVFVFDSKKPTPPRLLGRLELALGNILRDLRTEYGAVEPYAETLQSAQCLRSLKQAIRDRIRNIMDGKVVGTCTEVINLYRKKYPKQTDRDLLDRIGCKDQRKKAIAIDIIESDNPELYFKLNFNRLINETLNDMFKKLQEMYQKEAFGYKVATEVYDGILLEVQNSIPEGVVIQRETDMSQVVDNKKTADGENATQDAETQDKGQASDDGENTVKDDEKINAGDKNTDQDIETASKDGESATIDEEKVTAKTEVHENIAQDGSNTTQDGEKLKQSSEDAENSTDDGDQVPEPEITFNFNEFSAENIKAKFYNRLIETFLKRQLPVLLPKHKRQIMNMIKSNRDFMYTRECLVKNANEMPSVTPIQKNPVQPVNHTEQPFYVKVLGRPGLPKKKTMKSFLDAFHPILIKKHRNVHNILFVAFDKKEKLDKILAENGTMLGNIKLEIKISEKINRNPNHTSSLKQNDDALPIPEGTIVELDESLDNQITDLLTTIRQEEEKKLEETSVEAGDVTMTSVEDAPGIADDNSAAAAKEPTIENEPTIEIEPTVDGETENGEEKNGDNDENGQDGENLVEENREVVNKDVETVKNEIADGRATPTRSSTRLAATTPSTIRTRRASKLAQN